MTWTALLILVGALTAAPVVAECQGFAGSAGPAPSPGDPETGSALPQNDLGTLYVVEGTVVDVVSSEASGCATAGTHVSGEAWGGDLSSLVGIQGQNLAIVVKHTATSPGILHVFPPLTSQTTTNRFTYLIPPDLSIRSGGFVLTLHKADATAISLTLTTKIQNCQTTYNLKLAKGLWPALKELF